MNNPNPPERAERLVKWSLAPWERPAVMGDLQEEYRDLAETVGERAARRWYWRQAIASASPNVRRRLQGDARRHELWSAGMSMLAFGCLMMARWILPLSPERRDPLFLDAAWLVAGAIGVAQSLFRKRVREPVLQTRVLSIVPWVWACGAVVAALSLSPPPPYTTPAVLLIWFSIRLWPWWPPDPPPTEFRVRRKAGVDQNPDGLLTITVPNAPLGLSGVVLLHAPADRAIDTTPRPIRFYDPTLDRTFTPADAVRVCAVVNLAGPSAQATVDVVDATGHVARTIKADVAAGSLQQVAKSWDELADEDPAEHFGQVDVTLPLAGLAPGLYRFRLTATDAAHTSRQEESIVVRDASGRRER